MASRAVLSAAKEQSWREVIEGWRRSGGSVRQWCSQRQISEPSFYCWRRTLSARDAPVERKQPVPRESRDKSAPMAMIPVEIVPPGGAQQLAPLEITLGGGIHLLVRAHCESALLREALTALTALRPERGERVSC